MSSSRYKKLLGLALGEKSLLAAEVHAGDKPQVRCVAEFVYPEGVTPQLLAEGKAPAAEMGKALAEFLKSKEITTKTAIVGVPAKWLLVKPKEVPNAARSTMEAMLRLQAETEFSSELKDLVFDYASGTTSTAAEAHASAPKSVLLVATSRRQVEWIEALCEAAGLNAVAVTPSALALGRVTGEVLKRQLLVLMASDGASELTAQDGQSSSAIRPMRGLAPLGPFVSELRRTVSTLPSVSGGEREIVLWGGESSDADALGKQLGWPVRGGTLRGIGVDESIAGANGDGQKYAAAVALAVAGLNEDGPAVDFLHSRLAPPAARKIPNWAYAAGAAAVVVIALSIWAYNYEETQADALAKLQNTLTSISPNVGSAKTFVSKVSLAKQWHAGDPRYLACLRDLTITMPTDGQSYASNLTMKEILAQAAGGTPDPDVGKLQCEVDGRTPNQQLPAALTDSLKSNKAFSDVQLGQTNYIPRNRILEFTIYFKYDPTKGAAVRMFAPSTT